MQKNKKKVLIVGKDSKIGKACEQNLAFSNCEIWGTSRHTPGVAKNIFLDLTKPSLFPITSLPSFDYVLWTAAITDISTCERKPEHTWEINVEHTWKIIKEICTSRNKLIYFSTSEIFKGLQPRISKFTSKNPRSQYGCQKSEIENRIQESLKEFNIIRLTKVISEEFELFNKWCEKLRSGQIIRPFYDLYMSPISLPSVIQLVNYLILDNSVKEQIIQLSADEDFRYSTIADQFAISLGVDKELVQPRSGIGFIDTLRINSYSSLENTYPTKKFGPTGRKVITEFINQYKLKNCMKTQGEKNVESKI